MEIGFLFIGLMLVVLYFLPMIIALSSKHPNSLAISLLTFFTGWTGGAWIVLLIWSCLNPLDRVPTLTQVYCKEKH